MINDLTKARLCCRLIAEQLQHRPHLERIAITTPALAEYLSQLLLGEFAKLIRNRSRQA